MPKFNRLIFGGALPGSERWQCGLAFSTGGTNTDSLINSPTILDTAINDDTNGGTWATALTAMLFMCTAAVTLDFLKLTFNSADGKTIYSSQRGFALAGSVANSTGQVPNEVAMAVSVLSGVPGAKGRGRIYLPCDNFTRTSGSNNATTATCTSAATNTKALATKARFAFDNAGGLTYTSYLAVASIASATNYSVTKCRAGNILDSQRGRRKKEVETYQSVVIP